MAALRRDAHGNGCSTVARKPQKMNRHRICPARHDAAVIHPATFGVETPTPSSENGRMPAAPIRRRSLALGLLLGCLPALGCAGQATPQRMPASTVTAEVDGLSLSDIAWLRRDGFGLDSATLARYRELG